MVSNSTCDLFNDAAQCDAVIIAKRVTASISVLGCLLMLMIIVVYRKYSSFIQRIILYMTIAALLSAVSYVMGDLHEDGPFCTFQGFMTSFADWSVLMWMFMITLTLHLSVVKEVKLDHREWMFHILCWGVPLFASLLPFIDNHYGPSGAWCWIDDTYWRFGAWYIPLYLMLLVIVVLNSHMVYTVHRRARNTGGIYSPETENEQRRIMEEIKPLRAYPFLYLALNIIPLISRIQEAASGGHPAFALTVLFAISASLLGAVNACAFGLNKRTLNELRWSNFKLQVRDMCNCKRTEIGEYNVQEDDDVPVLPDPELNEQMRINGQ